MITLCLFYAIGFLTLVLANVYSISDEVSLRVNNKMISFKFYRSVWYKRPLVL